MRTRKKASQDKVTQEKATKENQSYLQPMLRLALSLNASEHYSDSGHEFVEVDMQDCCNENDRSVANPLSSNSSTGQVVSIISSEMKVQKTESHAQPEDEAQDHDEVSSGHYTANTDEDIDKALETAQQNMETPVQRTVSTPNCSTSTSNLPVVVTSQSATPLSNDEHADLRKRCSDQTESLRKYKKKIDAKNLEIAELKDLVVHAVAEAKAAKEDPNSNQPFETDESLNITCADVQHINSLSKTVGAFAQNLALHFYGAEELSKRSVTGRSYRGANIEYERKSAISPKKLNFIYNAAKDRIAQRVGTRNHQQISLLANKSIINRALAEKIANLNKARRTRLSRNAELNADPNTERNVQPNAEPNTVRNAERNTQQNPEAE